MEWRRLQHCWVGCWGSVCETGLGDWIEGGGVWAEQLGDEGPVGDDKIGGTVVVEMSCGGAKLG
jgi:hypothetical protein